MNDTTIVQHAGLLVPLDMFRLSQVARIFGELLVSKARNILDAKLVVSRPPDAPIVLMRIEGSVIEGEPAKFWKENADLVVLASRAIPRQIIMYYVEGTTAADRCEGFMVAQGGQMLAADDASQDRMPPGATEADWPVARLAEQLRVSPDDLAGGFPTGPRVEIPLLEPNVDDQALLMTLMGQDPGADGGADSPGVPAGAAPPTGGAPAAGRPTAPAGTSAIEDAKRREREQAEEQQAQERRAAEVQSEVAFELDDLGIVVAPMAELSEAEILGAFIVPRVEGDLPSGVPRDLATKLQGKRIDVAVAVDFLSEVFVENTPLARPVFEEQAQTLTLGGQELRRLEVLGPRLGYGTLLSTGKKHVFTSRKVADPVPADLVLRLLGEA